MRAAAFLLVVGLSCIPPPEYLASAAAVPVFRGAAVEVLLARHGVLPTPEQRAQVASLDALPEPVRSAFARFVEGFLGLSEASAAAFGRAGLEPDFGAIEAARERFLADVARLQAALAATPPEAAGLLKFTIAPALGVDLLGGPTRYAPNLALVLDAGGDDEYLNNAGGSGVLDCGPGATAALVDLGGNDRYASGRDCDINGGGLLGTGLLFDASGDDTYLAGATGTNGGAYLGSGFLLDGGGRDTYVAGSFGTNGGGYYGRGALRDEGGHDAFRAGGWGTNGGAYRGHGVLLDGGGDDAYAATGPAANGGALEGLALLLDVGGRDA